MAASGRAKKADLCILGRQDCKASYPTKRKQELYNFYGKKLKGANILCPAIHNFQSLYSSTEISTAPEAVRISLLFPFCPRLLTICGSGAETKKEKAEPLSSALWPTH